MEESLFKRVAGQSSVHKLGLIVAFAIGIILVVAAYGKFFHPLENLKIFDRWVSILEILFVPVIFFFRKRSAMWLSAAAIFAAWCGYASFWCCLQLPCSCMGSLIEMPTTLSIFLDVLFFSLSLVMGFLLGAARAHVYLALLAACFTSLAGYAFADFIYQSFVLNG